MLVILRWNIHNKHSEIPSEHQYIDLERAFSIHFHFLMFSSFMENRHDLNAMT